MGSGRGGDVVSSRFTGKRDRSRGVHKKATSPETRKWDREYLSLPPVRLPEPSPPPLHPKRPPWMDGSTYHGLCQLVRMLEAESGS